MTAPGVLNSALPDMARCSTGCGATISSVGPRAVHDDDTVAYWRDSGWQVVEGQWMCPKHLPKGRQEMPGAMGRRRNPHCSNCGDDRGGAYGHEAYECTWSAA